MKATMMYLFIISVVGLVAFFGGRLTARGAYETAEYKVIEADGDFEIREYPDLMLVTTSTQFEREGEDGSFMRLFRYINGANEAKQKIAMTTPVFMQPQLDTSQGQMAFVIPKDVAAQGTPKPAGAKVTVDKRAGGKFAVIRFAGRMNQEAFARAESRLRAWMTERGLAAQGVAETAGYDPPWTPGPLRRNEVLIRLR
jgi:hypothetical protein